jgi:hypothetical protein
MQAQADPRQGKSQQGDCVLNRNTDPHKRAALVDLEGNKKEQGSRQDEYGCAVNLLYSGDIHG